MLELIKIELFKNIEAFINEIDLTMDYVTDCTIKQIKKYLEIIKQDTCKFDEFITYTYTHLYTFETKLSSIFSKNKVNSSYYIFLNDIILFDNLLHFNVFQNEVKNTKKDFVKYLYNIYMSVVFINTKGDNITQELTTFISKIQNEANSLNESEIKFKNRRNALKPPTHPLDLSTIIPSMTGGTENTDLNTLMSSLMGNSEIFNIATNISKQMQDQQINPMTMLSGLMSGNVENSPLHGLVSSIQEQVEQKINIGEINKDELESQAQSIMNSIGGNGMDMAGMAGMAGMDMAGMANFMATHMGKK